MKSLPPPLNINPFRNFLTLYVGISIQGASKILTCLSQIPTEFRSPHLRPSRSGKRIAEILYYAKLEFYT